MSKQVWKGSALVAPVPPALVSCGTLEAPNVLTVAWTGMLQSHCLLYTSDAADD